MPEWGLTKDMRDARPWRLPREVLAPSKVITDPVHGDVYLNLLEQAIVDSPPFQRLRRVRQLGTTHLVYPGATHTRFAHSLGALRAVQDLLDVTLNQRDTRHGRPDLFEQWRDDLGVDLGDDAAKPAHSGLRQYYRKIGEAVVVTRLGALLHDIGHIPYGHSIEDDLLILDAHDENRERFNQLWEIIEEQRFFDSQRRQWRVGDLLRPPLVRQLRPLILSKARGELRQAQLRYPFTQDLVGNTICADLIDYLQRDHLYTGLPISLGHRYMTGFYVTPAGDSRLFPRRMALNIHRGGGERRDIVSELLKHLRYRYELQERVIAHHAKLAADAMVGKLLEMLHDALWSDSAAALLAPPSFAARVDPPGHTDGDLAELRREVELAGAAYPGRIDTWVKRRLEALFLSTGDDGLLEHLRDSNRQYPRGRRQAVAAIAEDLLDRRLFGHAAKVKGAKAADALYEKFSAPDRRRELEQGAARYAELSDGWKVVIWLPKPTMRLKQAEVLVDHGDGISRLVDYSSRGREIYDDHKALWSLAVFVHRDVTAEEKLWVLAYLSKEMLVHWEDREHELGADPERAPEHLAALRACDDDKVHTALEELLAFAAARPQRGGEPSGPQLLEHYRRLRAERDRRGVGRA